MNSYMKSSTKTLLDLQRERLEILLNQPTNTAYRLGRLGEFFTHLGQGIFNWLATDSTPKISKHVQGDAEVWKVYDPTVNRTLYFSHEDDLRIWMDQRYYH